MSSLAMWSVAQLEVMSLQSVGNAVMCCLMMEGTVAGSGGTVSGAGCKVTVRISA